MNMQSLMAQAQKMQRDIMKKKDEINNQSFTGASQGVDVIVNGKKEVLSIKVKPEFAKEDIEMIEDMIVIALNNAFKKVDEAVDKSMSQYGNAFNGLF